MCPRCTNTSNSGALLPTPEFEYRPKLFDDPRNNDFSKETMPPLESAHMPVLNIEKRDFLDWTEKLLGTDIRWEAHIVQWCPYQEQAPPVPVIINQDH